MTFTEDDCSKPEAKCIKMNNTQWMPFVTIGDFNTIKNLDNIVVPQFWTYVKDLDGNQYA